MTEKNLSGEYDTPVKTLTDGSFETSDVQGADGKIALGKDAQVVITNSFKYQLQVQKLWSGDTQTPDETVYVGLYRDGNALSDKYLILNTENNYTGTFEQLSGTETARELRVASEGEAAEFVIDGTGYIGIADRGKTSFGDTDYIVTYGDVTQDASAQAVKHMIITNIAVHELPETGGTGIYWYLIGGMLLLFAGASILYKKIWA